MTADRSYPAPPRLSQMTSDAAALFSDVESEFRIGLDEAHAWQKLQVCLSSPKVGARRNSRRRIWASVAAAAGLLSGWFGWQTIGRLSSMARRLDPILEQPSNSPAVMATIRLAAGKSQLPDGTEIDLRDGAEGTYRSNAQRSSVELDRGRLEIGVAHQPPGHEFVVKTKGLEFRAIGTRFGVTVNEPRVALEVFEGRVEVRDSAHALRRVEAGGHWSNVGESAESEKFAVELPEPSPSTRPSTPEPSNKTTPSSATASPNDPASCRDLLRGGKAKKSEQCYWGIAAGSGLSAEMALYEVARLRRDVLSNPSGSLSALDQYESRFASGTLAPEVRMARVELLARLGRVDEALSTSGQLLHSSSGRARAVELRLLRGNLLRDKQNDCAAAQVEYRLIESDPGPRGAEAQFALANCQERLGRIKEAMRTYRNYLERPSPRQAERARQRLRELQP